MADNLPSGSRSAFVRGVTALVTTLGGLSGVLWFIGYFSFLAFERALNLYGLGAFPDGFWKDILITFVADAMKSYGGLLSLLSGLAIVLGTGFYLKYMGEHKKTDGMSENTERTLKRWAPSVRVGKYGFLLLVVLLGLDISNYAVVPRVLHLGDDPYGRFVLYGILIPTILAVVLAVSYLSQGKDAAYLLEPRILVLLVTLGLLFLLVPYIYGSKIFNINLFEAQLLQQGEGARGLEGQPRDEVLGTFYLGYAKERQLFAQYPPTPAWILVYDSTSAPKFSLKYARALTIRDLFTASNTPTVEEFNRAKPDAKISTLSIVEKDSWSPEPQARIQLMVPKGALESPLSDEERRLWTAR